MRALSIFAQAAVAVSVCASVLAVASPSRAEVSILTLAQRDAELRASTGGGSHFASAPLSCVVRLRSGEVAPAHSGVSNVAPGWAVAGGTLDELATLAARYPEWRFTWTPPRRPLLDRAVPATGAPVFRAQTGATGAGVAIGVIDTGIDLTHPDFRNADGTTRVAWLLDFSRAPLGIHPEVEAQCADGDAKDGAACALPFAAYDAGDINRELFEGFPRKLPDDVVGHGTHVASLAASNGLSDDPPRYVGMAPEADLFIARVATDPADPFAFADPAILKAAQVLFWLAGDYRASLGLPPEPVVLNLSLGSDAGPHDDRSALGQALADMVGPEFPGRAIVTAGGNSAGLYVGVSDYPEPLGIHTEVDIPEGSTVRVPILTPDATTGDTSAEIFVWADFREGDAVSIGFEGGSGPWVDPVPPGYEDGGKKNHVEVSVANGQKKSLGPAYARSASVEVSGTWKSGSLFAVRFRGHGTVNLWVQSSGDLGPERSIGALFPSSTKEATISVPAAHPGLIAVGATINRTSWTTRLGDEIDVGSITGMEPEIGSLSFFSAAGPNSLGNIKPEIVAPGGFVVGAMSIDADPLDNPQSVFAAAGCDPPEHCLVVDDRHAVSAGTSMSAPIVSGAIALLLQQRPSLTQDDIRGLLETSAREADARLEQQSGAGALDMERLLDALDVMQSGVVREPASSSTRIISASSYARPDGEWAVRGLVQVRDAEGRIADGFDATKLELAAKPAVVLHELERTAPGLWRFSVAAPEGTGGEEMALDVSYGGHVLASKRLPIAVDLSVMRHGFSARGGCAIVPPSAVRSSLPWFAAALGLLLYRLRRRQSGTHTATLPSDPRRSLSLQCHPPGQSRSPRQ